MRRRPGRRMLWGAFAMIEGNAITAAVALRHAGVGDSFDVQQPGIGGAPRGGAFGC